MGNFSLKGGVTTPPPLFNSYKPFLDLNPKEIHCIGEPYQSKELAEFYDSDRQTSPTYFFALFFKKKN